MQDDVGLRGQLRNAGLHLFGRVSRGWTKTKRNRLAGAAPHSILLIRPDHLGDLLFTTPALTLLDKAMPEARLSCLVGPWAREVIANNPAVDEIITCDFPWFNRRPRQSALEPYLVLMQMATDLAEREFDVAVNLRFDFWWGALLAHLAGIPEVVGYDWPGCRPFLTKTLPYIPRYHEVEQNLRLVSNLLDFNSPLVREARGYPLRFLPTPSDESYVDDLLARRAVPWTGMIVAIHPGAGAPVKQWTSAGFAAVARALVEKYGATVLITGSSAERTLANEVAAGCGGRSVQVVAGETSLGQLGALFRRCAVVIGVDSGPLHLAVAVGRPTVHLFGPSDPAAFGPYGESAIHGIVSAGMECSPCGHLDLKPDPAKHQCMLAINADQVISAVEEVLAPPRRA